MLQVSQIAARNMIARNVKGAIVNISSQVRDLDAVIEKLSSSIYHGPDVDHLAQASLIALKDHTTYCTSKGGLDSLTQVMVRVP